ncbi:penicillin-binding protein 2 [Candidatus Poribacteria bacterium]|nr:penicillin-binding protein 2 [Candidatus Poribacteria bacterium]
MFRNHEIRDNLIRNKIRFILILVTLGFGVLTLRLAHLQIIKTEYYTNLSEGNRIRPVRLIPPRGVLYDRTGKEPLADNETAFDLCVVPDEAKPLENPDPLRMKIFNQLDLKSEQVMEKVKNSHGPAFETVVIKENIDKEVAAYLAENGIEMPELIIQPRPKRRYSGLATHVIGYTAPVSDKDIENGYDINDMIGKSGIEAEYEDYLKGDLGWKMAEVNAFGHIVRDLPLSVMAEPGQGLNLTIDAGLQRKAEELLADKTGTIIAVDPRNGEILVMASKPDFNPNIFSGNCSPDEWRELISNKDNPLLNRAVMGEYPPGSTFKIVTATAALQSGKVNENISYNCKGSFRLGKWRFKCHKRGGHGNVSMHRGIVESCNVYFYNLAYNRGIDVPLMHKYADMFGLGKKTGIDISGEKAGYIPKTSKYTGDKINMCIGQGQLLVTPLQLANMISVMANRGYSYKPHVVNLPGTKPEILVDIRGKVSPRNIEIVRNALKYVVERGYSKQANLPDYHTAGKTGTAQNPHGDDHAWFIGFGPYDNPEIALAVLIENTGLGSQNAAPVAGQIFAEYFYRDKEDKPLIAKQQ